MVLLIGIRRKLNQTAIFVLRRKNTKESEPVGIRGKQEELDVPGNYPRASRELWVQANNSSAVSSTL